ncbi:hypothetical protein BofuT4_uP161430.1 [Botrytis cinerea T4]|uniref:Uncharacterized protein n=1 Tax=Botryotinia fuckeliana (strain T4) TaxID=999810 RepID=G2YTU4_BOTF4|nr:hypothetical protein BofuT4_uP161430.1 [Botrytis cinerea T4]
MTARYSKLLSWLISMFKPTLDVHDAFFESLNVDYLTKKLALGIDNETMKLSNV